MHTYICLHDNISHRLLNTYPSLHDLFFRTRRIYTKPEDRQRRPAVAVPAYYYSVPQSISRLLTITFCSLIDRIATESSFNNRSFEVLEPKLR